MPDSTLKSLVSRLAQRIKHLRVDDICRAFFPLTGSPATYPALATYPVPQYSGYAMNAAQVADPLFGGAVMCERDLQAEVQLHTVPYATTGAFTVNVWVQVRVPFADQLPAMRTAAVSG